MPVEPDNHHLRGGQFDAAYPALSALRHGDAKLIGECEHAVRLMSEFRDQVAAPGALGWDARLFDTPASDISELLAQACRRGLLSLAIPHGLGGAGLGMLALSLGLEHLAAGCLGTANLLAVHGLALAIVGATGNMAQLQRLARRIVEGERCGTPYLVATAGTEAAVGSDLEDSELLRHARFDSHVEPERGGFRVYARKVFVSNGSLASCFVVLAPLDREHPRETLFAFLVDSETPGVVVSRVEHKLGQRICPTAEVLFDGCRIPESHRLDTRPLTGRTLDLVLGASRSVVGAFGAGVAVGAVKETARDATRQLVDGRPLLDCQWAQDLLARMWENAQLARASYVQALLANSRFGLLSLMEDARIRLVDRWVPTPLMALKPARRLLESSFVNHEASRLVQRLPSSSIAVASAHGSSSKVSTSRLAQENCELARQVLGGFALRESSGHAKRLRDARLLSIYEGTNEINDIDVFAKIWTSPGVEPW